MNTIRKKNDILETVYCVIVFLAVSYNVFQNSTLKFVVSLPGSINLLFIVACVLLSLPKKLYKSDLYLLAGIIIGLISYFNSSSKVLLSIMAFTFAGREYSFEKIVKTNKSSLLFSVTSVFLLDIVGVLPKIRNYVRNYSNDELRYTFGFTHPNVFALFVLALVCCYYISLQSQNIRFKTIIPCLIGVFLTSFLSKSYTVSLVLLVLLFVLATPFYKVVYRFVCKHIVFFRRAVIVFSLLLIGYIVFLAFQTNKSALFDALGYTASARLLYANRALVEYGVSFLGQEIVTYNSLNYDVVNYNYFTVDCLYILLLVRDGLLASVVFWFSMFKSIKTMVRLHYLVGTIIIVLLLVYSVMESGLSFLCFGFVFIIPYAKHQIIRDSRIAS